jgi:hypothetical protein
MSNVRIVSSFRLRARRAKIGGRNGPIYRKPARTRSYGRQTKCGGTPAANILAGVWRISPLRCGQSHFGKRRRASCASGGGGTGCELFLRRVPRPMLSTASFAPRGNPALFRSSVNSIYTILRAVSKAAVIRLMQTSPRFARSCSQMRKTRQPRRLIPSCLQDEIKARRNLCLWRGSPRRRAALICSDKSGRARLLPSPNCFQRKCAKTQRRKEEV